VTAQFLPYVMWQGSQKTKHLRARYTCFRGNAEGTEFAQQVPTAMPRPPRIYVPDVSLHVYQRGINRAPIVGEDRDRDHERLLSLIAHATTERGIGVHAFALMKNHYHLVVTPPAEGVLADAMQTIHLRYTKYFNHKYGRIGTMWNERYRANLLEDERYWYVCLRYVDLNPLRARLVEQAEAYRWSSYRVHALGEPSGWLTSHPLYEALGTSGDVRQAAFRAMCNVPLTEDDLAILRRPPRRNPVKADEPSPVAV
jgi:putative transposase